MLSVLSICPLHSPDIGNHAFERLQRFAEQHQVGRRRAAWPSGRPHPAFPPASSVRGIAHGELA